MSRDVLILIGVPLFAAAAMLASRRPEIPLLAALLLVAAEGSFQAYLGIVPYPFVSILLGAFVVGTLVKLVLARRESPLFIRPLLLPLAGYVALTAANIAAAESWSIGVDSFRDAAYFMLVGLLLAVSLNEERTRRRLVHGVVGIALLVGAYATLRYITGPTEAELEVAQAGNRNIKVGDGFGLIGSFSVRGSLARWAVHSIPICLAVALITRGPWRWVAALAASLCVVAMFGSEVRIALIAVTVATVIVIVLHGASRARPGLRLGTTFAAVVLVTGVGVGTYVATVSADPESRERFERIFTPSEDYSFGVRQTRWPEALALIEDNPLGVGLGVAGHQAARTTFVSFGATKTDNSYIQVAIEQGLPGLALLVLALLVLFVGLARWGIRARDPMNAAVAIGASASIAALMILMYTGLSINGFPTLLVWLMVGAAVGRARAPAPAPAPALARDAQPQPA